MKKDKKYKNINKLPKDELIINAENVLKAKKLNPNNKEVFEKTLKKAIKQHSLK